MIFRTVTLLFAISLTALCSSLTADDRTFIDAANQIRLDVFVRSDRESAKNVSEYLSHLNKRVPGLDIRVHDVLKDQDQLRRLYALAKKAGRDKPVLPAFNACDRIYFGFANAQTSGPTIESLFTANLYTRSTCPRCQKLKAFLPGLKKRWPAIRFVNHDVDRSAAARTTWESLCRGAGSPPGLPTIDFARRIIIGYQGDHVTGAQLEALIKSVSGTDRQSPPLGMNPRSLNTTVGTNASRPRHTALSVGVERLDVEFATLGALSMSPFVFIQTIPEPSTEPPQGEADVGEEEFPMDLLELPDEAAESEIGESEGPRETVGSDTIDVPFLGALSASKMGMPLFTFAVGLVDGFNPCAMWVLVFLLSVLVNIKDRRKILVIAGTFVVVSGLAYFAFMAAWLNIFLLIGIARPVQIALGLLAILIGLINVKDFFAFKKGISLSIPESQKPGLYRRVREIATAKYLTVALSGAVVLAVIVNMIELLCTAGLPALYTQVLTLQNYPAWKNYAFLMLYICAYMLDDAALVAIVVTTLSHRKLQEREGRWLKLLSGLVILVLGLVMLLRPAWLQLGS